MTPHFDLAQLYDMLTYARPCGSDTERAFVAKFIVPLGAVQDAFKNWRLDVGERPHVLWSCHTDTVHRHEGRQTLHVNTDGHYVQLSKRARRTSSCLGADDTTGVALCVQMARAGVPGRYVFHYGEEVGGLGSSDLSEFDPAYLDGIDYAIALDRRGYEDVITRQFENCCSQSFAWALSDQLNEHDLSMHFRPSSNGIFTDTANYTALVPECTNLSVGYFEPHSRHEWQDTDFVCRLFEALCKLDVRALPVERDVKDAQWSVASDYADYGRVRGITAPLPALPARTTFTADEWEKLWLSECSYCGNEYHLDDSSAADQECFCSAVCEEGMREHDRCYLDKTWADVQTALRKNGA